MNCVAGELARRILFDRKGGPVLWAPNYSLPNPPIGI